jgi:hypothetical protein
MTDLSPAAQAVLDAWDAKLNPMVTCLTHDPEREALAAVLRAVANQCKIEWNYHPDYPETESVIIVSELLAIADELGALPND